MHHSDSGERWGEGKWELNSLQRKMKLAVSPITGTVPRWKNKNNKPCTYIWVPISYKCLPDSGLPGSDLVQGSRGPQVMGPLTVGSAGFEADRVPGRWRGAGRVRDGYQWDHFGTSGLVAVVAVVDIENSSILKTRQLRQKKAHKHICGSESKF